MKKLIVLLVILIGAGNPIFAQLHPAYKILYTTTDETIGGRGEISHEVLVNDEKIKMEIRSVFPNRVFLGDKKNDTSILLYPSLSQYV